MAMNIEGDESLNRYFDEIASSEPLTAEEEQKLGAKIKARRSGWRAARDKLVGANLQFVVSIAREYQGKGVLLADLISAGNVGLITAVDRFDATLGFKFITYAVWWIRQAMYQLLTKQSRAMRIPMSQQEQLTHILRFIKEFALKHRRFPEPGEIACALNITAEMLLETMQIHQPAVSLDAQFGDDDGNSLLRILPDASALAPDAGIERLELERDIKLALDGLNEREATVLRLYFGFGDKEEQTLDEIGLQFGLTRERIRQIKEKALRRLRHPERRGLLEPHAGNNGAPESGPPKRTRQRARRSRKADPPRHLVACGHIKNSLIWQQLKERGISTIQELVARADKHKGDVQAMLLALGIQHGSVFGRQVSGYLPLFRKYADELDALPESKAIQAYCHDRKWSFRQRAKS